MSNLNSMKEILRQSFGDITAIWYDVEGHVSFSIVPAGMESKIVKHRIALDKDSPAIKGGYLATPGNVVPEAINIDNCIQLKVVGDNQPPGINGGSTMRNSASGWHFRLKHFSPIPNGMALVMEDPRTGIVATQSVCHQAGNPYITVETKVVNGGNKPYTLEYFPSFSLGLLSLFQEDDAPNCYDYILWRSWWAAEGRMERRSIESAGLEMGWGGYGTRNIFIGSRGSLPVHGFNPQIGFVDKKAQVVWGAAVNTYGAWELELSRDRDFFNISGGLTSRNYDGWMKTIQPGEEFAGPAVAITVAAVPDDAKAEEVLAARLVKYSSCTDRPEADKDLPVIFNEWCTNWGWQSREKVLPIAQRLENENVRYLVLDSGWYHKVDGKNRLIGDWLENKEGYPQGLASFCQEIRDLGLIPGIWFEFENVMAGSMVYDEHPEWLLTMDGEIICAAGVRAFLDFRKPEVIQYLIERVIGLLERCGIGYMKVDYNALIPLGCDGPNPSKSENLRQVMEAVVAFFKEIRRRLPHLVLEICASGGHRISPAWMQLGAMASSTDAHEGVEIPFVAANTAQLIDACNNQIWATLHPWDDKKRLEYSLAAGCIGRLCISGDIHKLSEEQMDVMRKAIAFQRRSVPILRDGYNQIRRTYPDGSYTHPEGEQIFMRFNQERSQVMIILHTFANAAAQSEITIPGNWMMAERFGGDNVGLTMVVSADGMNTTISYEGLQDFQAVALILEN